MCPESLLIFPSYYAKILDLPANSKFIELTSFTILCYYKNIVRHGEITKKAFNKASGLLNGMFDLAIEKGIVSVNVARNTPTRNLKFKPENDNSDMVYQPEERQECHLIRSAITLDTPPSK